MCMDETLTILRTRPLVRMARWCISSIFTVGAFNKFKLVESFDKKGKKTLHCTRLYAQQVETGDKMQIDSDDYYSAVQQPTAARGLQDDTLTTFVAEEAVKQAMVRCLSVCLSRMTSSVKFR